ncbi:PhnD/SsuA/transferrin family substrate-binding protein [Nostoc sp. JL33]|uniref:PhnD/SsuA/transferrin family substrate-binding protein n=1 Tax=Nostoc sp. JL33 TaxID=2815396 RepID=UPI0025CE75B5|nr:PhnD/SsuA/transferrin family substrate-binding protein [Nostoc sp. JL33]MBN3871502.1 PhnD/SsuA/transferrin family substrate-binding protein [Nostoc sp. JL33]
MKVLLPEGVELQGFERELKTTLEQAQLAGYALMGFAFREALSSKLHQIDALVVMEPGVFVCLEAKGYKGKWTGSANETWFSDNQEIKAVGGNPYIQVERYSLVIKDKLRSCIFQDIDFWVNYFVVAPDQTKFEIKDAVINTFQPGRSVQICNISRIEQVLGSIRTKENVAAKFNEIGIKKIISELTGISLEKIEILINGQPPGPTLKPRPVELKPVNPTLEAPPVELEPVGPTLKLPHNKYIHLSIILTCFAVAGIFAVWHYSNQRGCETATQTRVNGICYKDITKKPLVVGIITSPKQYSEFKTYLKNQLRSQGIDVVVEGNSEITYKDAQNNITKNKWDIVFANSPMNGMRAKDNSYKWLARMYPKYPLTYESVLFVRSDSSIKSIEDINSSTTIALGDFNSASSFYMPVYNLYGKSMTVTAGHRSSKIRELVANKKADIGAVVYSTLKDDPQFRVIQISREIPGTGVYLSPKLTPTIQKQIQNILENAPKRIKKQANYDTGEEPDYKEFRTIALRADQVLSCANFSRNPVQFFCNATSQGILGRVAGFTNQGNGMIRLRLERENHQICEVFVSSQTLNKITDGRSPEFINRKQVNITGVEAIEVEDGTCELTIENPTQLVVLTT